VFLQVGVEQIDDRAICACVRPERSHSVLELMLDSGANQLAFDGASLRDDTPAKRRQRRGGAVEFCYEEVTRHHSAEDITLDCLSAKAPIFVNPRQDPSLTGARSWGNALSGEVKTSRLAEMLWQDSLDRGSVDVDRALFALYSRT
jgi:hypothetical protein